MTREILPRMRNCTVGKESSEVDECLDCVSLIFLQQPKSYDQPTAAGSRLYRTVNQLR